MSDPNKPIHAKTAALVVDLDRDLYEISYDQEGMTLREHYAGLALQGILSGDAYKDIRDESHVSNRAPIAALIAVKHADALIKELSKP